MIYAFGDINVDMRWRMPHAADGRNLTIDVGGVAVTLARSAIALHEAAIVIGKVGADPFGTFAIQECARSGIPARLATAADRQTGIITLVPAGMIGVGSERLMFCNLPNANQQFSIEDFQELGVSLTSSDVVFATGYSLFRSPVREAALWLIRAAQHCGARVVFDLVPHELQQLGSSSEVLQQVKSAAGDGLFDLCIGEYRTWNYLFGCSGKGSPSRSDHLKLGRCASSLTRLACVRYGHENCDRQSLISGTDILFEGAETGYRHVPPAERAGYGEQLTASLIQQLYYGRHSWIYSPQSAFTIPFAVVSHHLAALPRTLRVIDIGCGYGRMFAELRRIGFTTLCGVDSSLSMIEEARRRNPQIPAYHGRIDDAASHGPFDLALLIAVLTTIRSDDEVRALLGSVRKQLAPGGRVLVCDFLLNDDDHHCRQYAAYRNVFPDAPASTFFSSTGAMNRHRTLPQFLSLFSELFRIEALSEHDVPTVSGHTAKSICALFQLAEE